MKIESKNIKAFFDAKAAGWDEQIYVNPVVINKLLDLAEIKGNLKVLDVACGTGVLFPYYLERGVIVTGVDFSSEMVKQAKRKYPEVSVLCADVMEMNNDQQFDAVMVYNAFPHFTEPDEFIPKMVSFVSVGGRVTIAHGMSKARLNGVHSAHHEPISIPLMDEKDLRALMEKYLDVDICIADDEKYIVSGVKKVI